MTPRKGQASKAVPVKQLPHSYTAQTVVEAIKRSAVRGQTADAFRKAAR
jgi:hypothetical protein